MDISVIRTFLTLRNDPVIKPICDILESAEIEYCFFGSRSVLPPEECQTSDYDIAIDVTDTHKVLDVLAGYNGKVSKANGKSNYTDKFTVATLQIPSPDVDISIKHNLDMFERVWYDEIDEEFYRKTFSKDLYSTPMERKLAIKQIMDTLWYSYVNLT